MTEHYQNVSWLLYL